MEIFGDGTRYEGSFASGEKHGYGTMVWPDGRKYEGLWADDKQHGEGEEHLPAGGTARRGIWENGVHVKWLPIEI